MRVADLVITMLRDAGVETVFMVPGGGAMHLNDAVGKTPGINYVCNLHEQASAIAAESYAKVNGNLGACLVTTGPGSTNALTGLVGAWLDSTPVVFIAGQVKKSDSSVGRGVRSFGVQEVDILPMVKNCTKYAASISDPSEAFMVMTTAIRLAREGRPGPVWVEIPLDVQAMEVDLHTSPETKIAPAVTLDNEIDEATISEVISLVQNAQRPVVLIGNGVRLSGCIQQVLELVGRWNTPVLLTWLAIDLIPDSNNLYVGRPGAVASRGSNFVLQNCDLLISIGARLDQVITAFSHKNFARSAKKVVVDIDEAEIRKLDMEIAHPVVSDASVFVKAAMHKSLDIDFPSRASWWTRCRQWKNRFPVVTEHHRSGTKQISVYAFAEAIYEASSEGTTIVSGSSGSGIEIFLHALSIKPDQRVIHTTALGSMGFALPSIIGAYVANPNRPIIAVDGDGGFFFNIQELETIRRLGIPVKVFVLNNNCYSSIRNSQSYWFGKQHVGADPSSGMTLPSICEVARAFGLDAMKIEETKNLKSQIQAILSLEGPLVVDTVVIPDESREPRVASIQRPDGTFISRPLEDMYPFLDRDDLRSEMIIDLLEEE
jgi:acetolactate synthase-1/2/3 large subunit